MLVSVANIREQLHSSAVPPQTQGMMAKTGRSARWTAPSERAGHGGCGRRARRARRASPARTTTRTAAAAAVSGLQRMTPRAHPSRGGSPGRPPRPRAHPLLMFPKRSGRASPRCPPWAIASACPWSLPTLPPPCPERTRTRRPAANRRRQSPQPPLQSLPS